MKTVNYYSVTWFQLFFMALVISVISAAIITINNIAVEYFQLPVVHMNTNDVCTLVTNYKNGEAFTCNDVDIILRKYRIIKIQ